jgi:hypothetical protein
VGDGAVCCGLTDHSKEADVSIYDTVRDITFTIQAWTWDHPWSMLTVPAAVGALFLADRIRNR